VPCGELKTSGVLDDEPAMTRSLPEKTFEHWTSTYVRNRFTKSIMWWPAKGEDFAVGLSEVLSSNSDDLVRSKVLLLELKVPEAQVSGYHCDIDIPQLNAYLARDYPVSYVFPVPNWRPPLTTTGGNPVAPPGIASAPEWWKIHSDNWFGWWTFVLSAEDVRDILAPRAYARVNEKRLFDWRFPLGSALVGPSSDVAPSPVALEALLGGYQPYDWRTFWDSVVACGPDEGTRWRIETGATISRIAPGVDFRTVDALPIQLSDGGDAQSVVSGSTVGLILPADHLS
jgi:hypothetical protein